MVRAAAKNHAHVGVVVDPADYAAVLDELRRRGVAVGGHPAPPGARRLRPHRRLRRGHRGVVRRRGSGGRARAATAHAAPGARACRGASLRGEPPSARRPLPRPQPLHAGGTAWPSTAARRCRTSTSSTPTRRGAWWPSSAPGRRARRGHHQARQPVRGRAGPDAGRRLPAGPRVRPHLRLRRRRRPGRRLHRGGGAGRGGRAPRPTSSWPPRSRRRRSRSSSPSARRPGCSRRRRTAPQRARAAQPGRRVPRPGRRPRWHDPAVGLAGAHQGGAHRRPVARHRAGVAGVCPDVVQRHRGRGRRTGTGCGSGPAEPRRSGRRSRCARPADRARGARRPATPSSPSETVSTCSPPPGWRPWCSRGDRSRTREIVPAADEHGRRHGAHRRAALPPLSVPVTARILDGEALAARMRAEITDRVAQLAAEGVRPGPRHHPGGRRRPQRALRGAKHADCAEVGIASVHEHLPKRDEPGRGSRP